MRYLLVPLFVMTACGGDGDGNGRLVDGSAFDSPATDTPVEVPPQPVTVTVRRNGQPVPNVHTYFLDSSDAVVATVDTDAMGTASAMLTSGSVTVVDPFAPAQPDPQRTLELRSWVGVKPGDHLVVSKDDPTPITVTINAPASPGATGYSVLTTCGTGSLSSRPTRTLTLSGCNGVADILVIARAGTGNSALYRAGVVVADNATVDLTTDTYRPFKQVTVHYSHIPSAADGVSGLYAYGTPNGALGYSNAEFEEFTRTVVDGSATLTFDVPDVSDGYARLSHSVQLNGKHDIEERQPYATSYDLDFAGLLLPDWMEVPGYDAANRRIAWTNAAGGATPDFQVGVLLVSPGNPVRGAAAAPAQSWSWQLIAPYTANVLKLPVLPTDVADWTPQATDQVEAISYPFKLPGGYDALRAKIFGEGSNIDLDDVLANGERIVHIEN